MVRCYVLLQVSPDSFLPLWTTSGETVSSPFSIPEVFCKHCLAETHVDWILGIPDYIANEAFSVAVLFSLPTVLSKFYWANSLL